jgi:hypothetical protein
MRIGYAMLLATCLASPAIAQQVIIQGPNPGAAARDERKAVQADREVRHDLNAARREENEARRDARHGDISGAMQENREAQRDLREAQQDSQAARRDLNKAEQDESWRLRIR